MKLTDFINERVTELIQIGFNAHARMQLGGAEVDAPMTIIEKRGDSYHRIPEGTLPEWTAYCRYIREFQDSGGLRPGDQLCRACDAKKAEEFVSGKKRSWELYTCHAGLIDIAIPIIVGGVVVAVFFGGQKRLKNDTHFEAQLSEKIKTLNKAVPGLNGRKLRHLASQVPALSQADINEFAKRMSEIVSHIGDLARRNYEARKAVEIMGRFSEEYMSRRRPLDEVLTEVLRDVAQFMCAEKITIVRDTYRESLFSSHPPDPAAGDSFGPRKADLTGVLAELGASIGKARLITPNENLLLQHLSGLVGESNLRSAVVKQVTFAGGNKGLFVLANPEWMESGNISGGVVDQRLEFVQDLTERLRTQIDTYELDREKDDLMAEVTHRLKSPLQWLISETSTLPARLNFLKKWVEVSPTIPESLIRIEEVVDFLDIQIRNYTIIATMDKGGIAYDFRPHPIGTLLKKCCKRYHYLAKSRGIEVRESVSQDCFVRSSFDWSQLEVAIHNLLDNAIKYSHSNQVVHVAASLDRGKSVYSVRIDSFGVGIAEEEWEAIFEKFRRGRIMKDPRRFIPGTGIGLTVARRIARDHGGDVKLLECKQGPSMRAEQSAEGWRVVFELELPLKQEGGVTGHG